MTDGSVVKCSKCGWDMPLNIYAGGWQCTNLACNNFQSLTSGKTLCFSSKGADRLVNTLESCIIALSISPHTFSPCPGKYRTLESKDEAGCCARCVAFSKVSKLLKEVTTALKKERI